MPTASLEDVIAKIRDYMLVATGDVTLSQLHTLVQWHFSDKKLPLWEDTWEEAVRATLNHNPDAGDLVSLKPVNDL